MSKWVQVIDRILDSKWVWWWMGIVFLVFVSGYFLRTQLFFREDLGRHVKNGEVVVTTGEVPRTNLYSFTEGDRPVVMHHWLAGVVYYLAVNSGGFETLSLVSGGVYVVAIGLGLWAGSEGGRKEWVGVVALLSLPIIVMRHHIRPESFSYVLLMVYVGLLVGYLQGKIKQKWLWALPPLMVLWVNTHIFFVMGMGLVGLAAVVELLGKLKTGEKKLYSPLFLIGVVTGLSSLVNPFGFDALLQPFEILSEGQALVVENFSIPVFQRIYVLPNLDVFMMVGLVLGLVLVWKWRQWDKPEYWFGWLVLVATFWLGFRMVRMASLFGYVALAIAPMLLGKMQLSDASLRWLRRMVVGLLGLMVVGGVGVRGHMYSPIRDRAGLGLEPGIESAGQWLVEQEVEGPIMNNYNVGGYLIYYLYPQEQVFVDNRWEAYSSEFYTQIYRPLDRGDESVWESLDEQYGFQAMVLSYGDGASDLVKFRENRLVDPKWVEVYRDQVFVILLREGGANQELIDKLGR